MLPRRGIADLITYLGLRDRYRGAFGCASKAANIEGERNCEISLLSQIVRQASVLHVEGGKGHLRRPACTEQSTFEKKKKK
jgi:hypothetical protein